MGEAPAVGRVLQVNVSPGGVPKIPVERAHVGPLGLDGDAHRDTTGHGGPHRAVALFAIEAIRRVAADGHPIFPGSCGENVTTEGVELALLPVGSRLAIGDRLVLELSKPDNPCETIKGSFADGRFARISVRTHPSDTRMYARVLVEGEVRPGDRIRVLPPAADSQATTHVLMDRLEAAERRSDLARWRAAETAGFEIAIVDDGELAIGASRALPGPAFNGVDGLRELPNLMARVLDHFRAAGSTGWLPMNEPPWPGADPDYRMMVLAIEPDRVPEKPPVDGLLVRAVGPDETDRWANDDTPRAIAPHLAHEAGHHLLVGELDGRAVASALLVTHGRVGLLRGGSVLPSARGRGIHRALIAHRARLAGELGCNVLMSQTGTDNAPSLRNLERMGFVRVWERDVYRFDPSA